MVGELVARARSGDGDAFGELVARFQDAVFATAYGIVGDYDEARDVAQEAFVRAYESLLDLRDVSAFPGWLLRICRSVAMGRLRKPMARSGVPESLPAPAADPGAIAAGRDLVARALEPLTENGRQALLLWLVDGYTYNEVAGLTGVPLSTAKGRIHRARRRVEREVLAMMGETLRKERPDESFTLETVEECLGKAEEAKATGEWGKAIGHAEQALSVLSEIGMPGHDVRDLRLEALGALSDVTLFRSPQRWEQAQLERARLLDEAGEPVEAAYQRYLIATYSPSLSNSEKDDLARACVGVWRAHGAHEHIARDLFFRGWRAIVEGRSSEAYALFDGARSELKEVAGHTSDHALLAAAERFRLVNGGRLTAENRWACGAVCDVGQIDGDRLVLRAQPGCASQIRAARYADPVPGSAFGLLWFLGWYPLRLTDDRGPWEKPTSSYSMSPTRTTAWLEQAPEPVETPAGTFRGCVLLRASVSPPTDEGPDATARAVHAFWVGEYYCLFAPGVGPIAYRHDGLDGPGTMETLYSYSVPSPTTDLLPLSPGTLWEYGPHPPADGIDGRVFDEVTHVSDDGKVYIARTYFAVRT